MTTQPKAATYSCTVPV